MGKISHYNCARCAVGTLVGTDDWISVHGGMGELSKGEAVKLILTKTKYSIIEIYNVEKEFEGRERSLLMGNGGKSMDITTDRDGFKGLCNVFDYLVSIEDWKEEESKINLVEMCLQNN